MLLKLCWSLSSLVRYTTLTSWVTGVSHTLPTTTTLPAEGAILTKYFLEKNLSLVGFLKYFVAWCQKIRPISTSTDGHQFGRISTFSERKIFTNVVVRYLKDYDMYQRQLSEQKRSEKPQNLKRTRFVLQENICLDCECNYFQRIIIRMSLLHK